MRKRKQNILFHTKIIQNLQNLSLQNIKKKVTNKNTEKKYRRSKTQLRLKINSFQKYPSKNQKIYILVAIISVIVITIGFLLYSPIFTIKNINILRKDNVTNIEIAYKSIEHLRGKSIFSLDTSDTFKRIENYQNNVESIATRIIPPNTLKITVSSHKELFNTKINEKNYSITKNGTLIPKKPSLDIPFLNIILPKNPPAFFDYKKILPGAHIQYIEEIRNKLIQNILTIKIEEIIYFSTQREAHFLLESDTRIIFDLTENINEQIEKLAIFHKEEKNIQKNDIIYIDLRIKNKLYYCDVSEEFQCKENIKSVYES